jgi:FAD/FMN-containing dehydrogenase
VVKDDEETLLRYSKDSSDHPPILPSVVILPRNLNDVIRAVEVLRWGGYLPREDE